MTITDLDFKEISVIDNNYYPSINPRFSVSNNAQCLPFPILLTLNVFQISTNSTTSALLLLLNIFF